MKPIQKIPINTYLRSTQRIIIINENSTNIAEPFIKGSSKNRRMPLVVTNTRYSLVKGERIIRFVLIT